MSVVKIFNTQIYFSVDITSYNVIVYGLLAFIKYYWLYCVEFDDNNLSNRIVFNYENYIRGKNRFMDKFALKYDALIKRKCKLTNRKTNTILSIFRTS